MDLVDVRKHSLVAFNWKHERDALIELAEKRGYTYEVIDGSVPAQRRPEIVQRFQAGQIKVLFAHPQSAGHGLTLTKANTIIWCHLRTMLSIFNSSIDVYIVLVKLKRLKLYLYQLEVHGNQKYITN